jgi:protein CpxP
MDKIKILTAAVLGLLILNMGTLGYLILNGSKSRRPHPHREGPKNLIVEKLHFDKKQEIQYEALILGHRNTIDSIDQQIRQTKNRLYLQLIKTNVDTTTKDSLIAVIANEQKQIEQTHFKHFQDIKKLCNTEQLEDYYDLTEELSRIFGKPPKPRND